MIDSSPLNFDFLLSFEKWVKFVFDHPPSDEIERSWYCSDECDDFWDEWHYGDKANRESHLKYATELFHAPAFLRSTYSPKQIDQGFWFLLNWHHGFGLNGLIWDRRLSWPIPEKCILAMVKVFEDVFVELSNLDSCYMWWDLLLHSGTEDDPDNDPRLKEAMFQAMSKILEIPSLDCQISALHGLGHLKHPAKKAQIENYLARNPNWEVKLPGGGITVREYALAAIEGKVL
jgi:hypothetical protein